MDWITTLCNKCCSTLEIWPRHHFNIHPVQNNCQWKSIFWKWNFLERTYTHKTRTFSLPANSWKIWHDLEILHVQSEERFTEIPTQLLFGHPANTNQPYTIGKSTSDLCKPCLQAGAELQGRRQENKNHILNGCKVALHQKRYTWRHNNLFKYITGLIDIDRFLMYADIPSHTLPGGGTVPPHLLVL